MSSKVAQSLDHSVSLENPFIHPRPCASVSSCPHFLLFKTFLFSNATLPVERAVGPQLQLEAGGLRLSPGLQRAGARVHPRGGDSVVPGPRNLARRERLLHAGGRLVSATIGVFGFFEEMVASGKKERIQRGNLERKVGASTCHLKNKHDKFSIFFDTLKLLSLTLSCAPR